MKPNYQILNSYDHLVHHDGIREVISSKKVGRRALEETIKAIIYVLKNYAWQVKPLASHLYDNDQLQAVVNVHHFIRENLRYGLDRIGMEEIRTPSASWENRKVRVDCEDYTIFGGALLLHMGHPVTFRIVAYKGESNHAHIYGLSGNFEFDRLADQPDRELQNIDHSRDMNISILNGHGGIEVVDSPGKLGDLNHLSGILSGDSKDYYEKLVESRINLAEQNPNSKQLDGTIRAAQYGQALAGAHLPEAGIYKHIEPFVADVDHRAGVTISPGISGWGRLKFKPGTPLPLLDLYLDQQWDDYQQIGSLMAEIEYLDAASYALAGEGIGRRRSRLRDLVKKIKDRGKDFVEKVKTKEGRKELTKELKKAAGDAIKNPGKTAKTIANGVTKFIPALVIVRNAFRAALRLNVFGMARKLAYAWSKEKSVKQFNMDKDELNKLRKSAAKTENLYYAVGGFKGIIKDTALAWARSKNLPGLAGGLGDAGASAAATTAASGLIAKVLSMLKHVNWGKLFKHAPEIAKTFKNLKNIPGKEKIKEVLENLKKRGGNRPVDPETLEEMDFEGGGSDNDPPPGKTGISPIIWVGGLAALAAAFIL